VSQVACDEGSALPQGYAGDQQIGASDLAQLALLAEKIKATRRLCIEREYDELLKQFFGAREQPLRTQEISPRSCSEQEVKPPTQQLDLGDDRDADVRIGAGAQLRGYI